MAIIVGKLYSNSTALYGMQLIAGHRGLNNLVEWVHIVEDPEVCAFLHGRELIFTAGYMNTTPDWLLHFTKCLYETKVSAFVINIGPYIGKVPQEIIDYCNEVDLPLFIIPWKTKMVDMTRDFASRIMHNASVEDNIVTTVKNIIFRVGNSTADMRQMERYGYQPNGGFCFFNISLDSVDSEWKREHVERLKYYFEQEAKVNRPLFISFQYDEHLVVLMPEENMDKIRLFVEHLILSIRKEKDEFHIHMGISTIARGFETMPNNFEKAALANRIAKKKRQRAVYYDDLDLYKILISVSDKEVLREYQQEVLGRLSQYDAENGTELLKFLELYLECNGSPQLVAEQNFIHRNTVNNHIKKIERITGYSLLDLEEKLRCKMALMIGDLV